jgi:hypothetical protein
MTVEPHDWISWSDARLRMLEIWDGWRYRLADPDQALVNSLRRGTVSCRLSPNNPRAGAYEDSGLVPFLGPLWGKRIDLRDVVAGLLTLRTFESPIRAEYETEGLSHPPGWAPRKWTQKQAAVVWGAELAWDELRDDLISFELPAGERPNRPKLHRTAARRRREPAPMRPAPSVQIHQAITEVYDQAEAAGEKPPNVNEVIKPVQEKLHSAGYHASGRQIRKLADNGEHALRRWGPGVTRSSKKRAAER